MEVDVMPSEVVSISSIQAIESASVDKQIATAKQYPRNVDSFLRRATSMISEDADRASEMGYSLTRSGKVIVGPSVRLAEVAVNAWGNLRLMIVEEEVGPTDTRVRVYGMAHDLETNVAIRIPKVRRITNREGRRFSEDMIATTINAAVSLAFRDAAFRVIPRVFVDDLYAHAMRVAAGDEESLPDTRKKLVAAFTSVGVTEEMLFRTLDVEGINGIQLQHIGPMRSIFDRIRRGEMTASQAFPETQEPEAEATADAIKKGKKKTAAKSKRATPARPKSAKEPEPHVEQPAPSQESGELGEGDI